MTPTPLLRPGDAVSVIAPSGPFDRATFERGLAVLATRYRPVFDEGIFSADRYLAGTDERRLAELQAALHSTTERAVFCARGGYGAMRLLPHLELPRQPKALVGFSDITAIHSTLQAAGWRSVHGPVITQLGRLDRAAAQELFELLEYPDARPLFEGTGIGRGVVEGPVVGGNLSVFTRLLGTPYMPPLHGTILFLEDVGERPYRLDRMWHHLALAGVFRRVAGIALGEFTDCDERDGSLTSEQVVRELALATHLPCVSGLPIGHGLVNRPLPLGARARLDGDRGTLTFLEGAVQ